MPKATTKIILILLFFTISTVNANIILDLFSRTDHLAARTEMIQVAFGEESSNGNGNSNSNSNANHNGGFTTSRTPTKNSDKMKVIISE